MNRLKAIKRPDIWQCYLLTFDSPGATAIVFGLPVLLWTLFFGCNDVSGCPAPALLSPRDLTWAKLKSEIPWPENGVRGFVSWEVTFWTFAYYFLSLVLHRVMPAEEVVGTKLRDSGRPLTYRFNGTNRIPTHNAKTYTSARCFAC